jgi:lysophospholipid acyltransferase (LPLAT)-like uncharacterized protein
MASWPSRLRVHREEPSASRLSRSQLLKARLIAAAGSPLAAALGRTLTWRVQGAHHFDDLMRAGRPPILALWHGRILPATLFWRDRGIVVIISANFDGEWISRLIARFGYRSARGSTSRGGSRALVQLRRELAKGHPVGFTVDGPRGPARVAQPGAVWLAAATGHPILPFHMEASRYWTAGSWDSTQVPRPFSTVGLSVGAPIEVPSNESEDARLQQVQRLESTLKDLEVAAARLVAGQVG